MSHARAAFTSCRIATIGSLLRRCFDRCLNLRHSKQDAVLVPLVPFEASMYFIQLPQLPQLEHTSLAKYYGISQYFPHDPERIPQGVS